MSQTILGVDFGSSALKLALWDGEKVLRLVEEPMPDRLVRSGSVVSAEAMAAFLRTTLKKHKLAVKRAGVILPASQVFLQRSELPPMTEAQLKLNLPYEFRDFITEDRDRYFYDYAVLNVQKDENDEPVKLELLAAAVPKELIRQYEDMFRWAGLKLKIAVPAEVAYGNLLRRYEKNHPEEAGITRCIVDFGHTGCRTFFYGGSAFETLREGDRGGAAIDDLLAELLHADPHIARAYKESNQQGELELPEVRAAVQDILREIQRTVNFYSYNNPDKDLRRMWIGGGGSRIPHLAGEIQELVGIQPIPVSGLVASPEEPSLVNTCAAAIGAVMQ